MLFRSLFLNEFPFTPSGSIAQVTDLGWRKSEPWDESQEVEETGTEITGTGDRGPGTGVERKSAAGVVKSSSSPLSHPALMTGASLLAKAQATPLQNFAIAAQVRHPRYGVGTIIELGGSGPRQTVKVQFAQGDRVQQFIAANSPLQVIGS